MHVKVRVRARDSATLKKVAEISGENVYKCMQCGTCTAVCPMAAEMDVTPRAAMLLMQHGFVEQVLDSKTPWLCASCHNCEVRCPRGIEVARAIEALRQIRLRENEDRINPRAIPTETLSEAPQVALVSVMRKLTA